MKDHVFSWLLVAYHQHFTSSVVDDNILCLFVMNLAAILIFQAATKRQGTGNHISSCPRCSSTATSQCRRHDCGPTQAGLPQGSREACDHVTSGNQGDFNCLGNRVLRLTVSRMGAIVGRVRGRVKRKWKFRFY